MAKITCNSGREYILGLGMIVVQKMIPEIDASLTPEMKDKFIAFNDQFSEEEREQLTEGEAMGALGLTDEERDIVVQANRGPNAQSLLSQCLLKVNGQDPSKVVNPDTEEPYGSIDSFLNFDEMLVDDLPEIMDAVYLKLAAYNKSVIDTGELTSSSQRQGRTRKAL